MFKRVKNGFRTGWNRGTGLLTRRPTLSFIVLVALLFGIIALGHHLRTPKDQGEPAPAEKKEAALFDLGRDTAFLAVPAEVKKESLIDIVALTPGIVSNIFVVPGKSARAGQTLLSLTGDYQSGAAEIQKQIARNTDELTRELADIDKKIFRLEARRIPGDITLSEREEEIALKRLKKDREMRKTTIENSQLTVRLAELSDAVLRPKTFASGTIESVRVKRGDFVSAGDILVTLRATKGASTLEALVSRKTAELFDPTKSATLTFGSQTFELLPTYFSTTETENGLFSILFTLGAEAEQKISDGEFLEIRLPLRAVAQENVLIPIDAVFQDDAGATLLVEEEGKAVNKTVTLGNIYGSFAEVTSGLAKDARVILNRAVIAGDEIAIR